MLFRAIFWIGLVAVLLPRAPHFSPGAATTPVPEFASSSLAALEADVFERLLQIRADIEAQQSARGEHPRLFHSE